jgi:hypothetical protein
MVASNFDLLYPGYGLDVRTGGQHITQTMVQAMHCSHGRVSQHFALAAASRFPLPEGERIVHIPS